MSQSEWLGAVLIAGFIVWLAMNGKLGRYWSILLGGGAASPPASSGVSSGPVAPVGSPPTVTAPPASGVGPTQLTQPVAPASSQAGQFGGQAAPNILRLTIP